MSKEIRFKFNSEETYKKFIGHLFNSIEDNIIDAMECHGGLCRIELEDQDDKTDFVIISWSKEI